MRFSHSIQHANGSSSADPSNLAVESNFSIVLAFEVGLVLGLDKFGVGTDHL
jgi:hypothetical protein